MSGKRFLAAVSGQMVLSGSAFAGQEPPPPQRHESVVVNIEVPVRVKNRELTVTHRLGYIAD
jgi:hypothetical protein